MDQRTNFMSNEINAFCNGEGIEMIKSSVNDHRATGCVERTIGSLKNSILTFVRKKTRILEENCRKNPWCIQILKECNVENLAIRGAPRSRSDYGPKKFYEKTLPPKSEVVEECLFR